MQRCAGNLRVLGKTDTLDFANFTEESTNSLLVNLEWKVTDEQGITLGADRVTKLLGAIICAGVGGVLAGGTRFRGIEVQCTTL